MAGVATPVPFPFESVSVFRSPPMVIVMSFPAEEGSMSYEFEIEPGLQLSALQSMVIDFALWAKEPSAKTKAKPPDERARIISRNYKQPPYRAHFQLVFPSWSLPCSR
jgi:hypothetical protein